MSNTNEITYLFGAGASFQSMPLVNSFCNRYDVYLYFLSNTINADRSFVDYNRKFLKEIKSHLSFDTYFKKLFHQKNKEIEVQKGKYLIYLYFLFEHLIDLGYFNEIGLKYKLEHKKDFASDPRYDALIAGLLKPVPQTAEFFCPINILTWNYDLNLTYSIYNFLGANISFQEFSKKNSTIKNVFNFDSMIRAIHLNGLINSTEITGSLGSLSYQDLASRFQRFISNFNNESHIQESISSLSFSWENIDKNGKMPDFINKAVEAVERSHSIIVIGYSFPLYNRLFDLTFLNLENLSDKTIYVVDPRASELKDLLHSDFDLPDKEVGENEAIYPEAPLIIPIDTRDYFFVPPNLFKKKYSRLEL